MWPALAALITLTPGSSIAEEVRRVLVLYPVSDGQPGIVRFDEGLRAALKARSGLRVEIYNEYLDSARFPAGEHQRRLAEFLRAKYDGQKLDAVVAALAPSLDFALRFRDEVFPGVPIVFGAVEEREVATRRPGAGVLGVPMKVDLGATLDLALRLHPATRRVCVIAGSSKTDEYWVEEARREFVARGRRVEFVYLTGRPLDEILREVASLPDRSLIYYLHVFRDASGQTFTPAEAAGRLCAVANAPVYGNYRTYLGRGVVGGYMVRFDVEGERVAALVLRMIGGAKDAKMDRAEAGANPAMFDWRQLRRWGIAEAALPPDSIVLDRPPGFWELYRWRIVAVVSLCLVEAILIVALLVERANRRRAEADLRGSQRELRALTGRLLQAQEAERRRIARELHDDLNQNLALLAVHLDLLGRELPEAAAPIAERIGELAVRVKQMSSVVHDLSSLLHPTKLEQLGIVPSLRGLCQELARAHGLAIDCVADPAPPSIPDEVSLCLYRIAQEGLRNVVRHSGARRARVELEGTPGGVALRVADDGVGFDAVRVVGGEGLGLVSMRERLVLVGGTLTIESRPSAGTRLNCFVPLPAPARSPRGWPEEPGDSPSARV